MISIPPKVLCCYEILTYYRKTFKRVATNKLPTNDTNLSHLLCFNEYDTISYESINLNAAKVNVIFTKRLNVSLNLPNESMNNYFLFFLEFGQNSAESKIANDH